MKNKMVKIVYLMKNHSTGDNHRVPRRKTVNCVFSKALYNKSYVLRVSGWLVFIISFYMKAASIPIPVLTYQWHPLPVQGNDNFLLSYLSILAG